MLVFFLLGMNLVYRFHVAQERVQNPENFIAQEQEEEKDVFKDGKLVIAQAEEEKEVIEVVAEVKEADDENKENKDADEEEVSQNDEDNENDETEKEEVKEEKSEEMLKKIEENRRIKAEQLAAKEAKKIETAADLSKVLEEIQIEKPVYTNEPAVEPVYPEAAPVEDIVEVKEENDASEYLLAMENVYENVPQQETEVSAESVVTERVITNAEERTKDGVQEIKVYMYDNGLSFSRRNIAAGFAVFEVQNLGKLPHDIALTGGGTTQNFGKIVPNQTRYVRAKISGGQWTFYSPRDIDVQRGLSGTFSVQ